MKIKKPKKFDPADYVGVIGFIKLKKTSLCRKSIYAKCISGELIHEYIDSKLFVYKNQPLTINKRGPKLKLRNRK